MESFFSVHVNSKAFPSVIAGSFNIYLFRVKSGSTGTVLAIFNILKSSDPLI